MWKGLSLLMKKLKFQRLRCAEQMAVPCCASGAITQCLCLRKGLLSVTQCTHLGLSAQLSAVVLSIDKRPCGGAYM